MIFTSIWMTQIENFNSDLKKYIHYHQKVWY